MRGDGECADTPLSPLRSALRRLRTRPGSAAPRRRKPDLRECDLRSDYQLRMFNWTSKAFSAFRLKETHNEFRFLTCWCLINYKPPLDVRGLPAEIRTIETCTGWWWMERRVICSRKGLFDFRESVSLFIHSPVLDRARIIIVQENNISSWVLVQQIGETGRIVIGPYNTRCSSMPKRRISGSSCGFWAETRGTHGGEVTRSLSMVFRYSSINLCSVFVRWLSMYKSSFM